MIGTLYGLLWTYIASSMLIDLLGLYVIVFRLDTTFMGLTVLGIGNALPDALTTIALAKKGYAQVFFLILIFRWESLVVMLDNYLDY